MIRNREGVWNHFFTVAPRLKSGFPIWVANCAIGRDITGYSMKTVLIANPKGGSGKTTIATNLAGYFASRGESVLLDDMDRQRSATDWLARRPDVLPTIHGWSSRSGNKGPDKSSLDWAVVDTPAGLHGEKLTDALKRAAWVIVPVSPSAFDMAATTRFLEDLRAEKTVSKAKIEVAMIGMRVDARTLAAAALRRFLDQTGFPLLTMLCDTQIYVHAASEGLSLFDIVPSRISENLEQWQPYKARFENTRFIKSRAVRELEQWQPVLDWLDQ
jgi:chromosome partitioning protein